MKRKILAGIALLGVLLMLGPAPKAVADGAASTRNILMGIGAAAGTLLIINHNKQVHEKYAQDAATQAALAEQRNNAEAAYQAELRAYTHEVAVAQSYKKEVAVKDQLISNQDAMLKQQKDQLAQLGVSAQPVAVAAAPAPPKKSTQHTQAPVPAPNEMVSYGWGTL